MFLKVEVSKFEALEEVSAELKLKQLLWDSLSDWGKLQQEWSQVQHKLSLRKISINLEILMICIIIIIIIF